MPASPVFTDPGLTRFNALDAAEARRALLACCAATRWADALAAARPYPDRTALRARADAELTALTWNDITEALDAHPRIGDRAAGDDRSAAWSRGEQSGAAAAPDDVRAALAAGNLAYERRFGHVFLIRAAGLSAERMLAALRARLEHEPEEERAEVRRQLGGIAWLRLERLLDGELAEAEG
ncbi:MAG TPA: 2-oxo-4-hydroxy-4-carboxy-5-ureidoimidazoline decarboxylase [Streptosporangiaceae bacterium]|jgi:2-oxo-4-hydroxy-4-carboxy-5-ureidoimidazoline decarboxylase